MKKSNEISEATSKAAASVGSAATGFADIGKISKGLNMVFQGYSMMFDAMAEQVEKLGMIPEQKATETVKSEEVMQPQAGAVSTAKADAQTEETSESEEVIQTAKTAKTDSVKPATEVPADAPQSAASDSKEKYTITLDDISKVITTKLEQCGTSVNRDKFNKSIRALLGTYLSSLPDKDRRLTSLNESQYEGFLNDVAQITV